jgi:hypothetical protein
VILVNEHAFKRPCSHKISTDKVMRMPIPSGATRTSSKCWWKPLLSAWLPACPDVGNPCPKMNTPGSLAWGTLRNRGIALLGDHPGLVGVVFRHGRRHLCRVRPKVLLKHCPPHRRCSAGPCPRLSRRSRSGCWSHRTWPLVKGQRRVAGSVESLLIRRLRKLGTYTTSGCAG